MSRKPRQDSETRIFNVGQKGHNGVDVFFDDEDRAEYLLRLRRACATYDVLLLAFTLMSNHVHLVLQGDVANLELVFKSLGSSFGQWYNKKYDRSGTLWNGRYYSDPIKDDKHLLAALGYIYNNPVAAGIVKSPEEYEWSSFNELDNPASDLVSNAALAEVIDVEALKEYTLDSAKDKAKQWWNRKLEVIPPEVSAREIGHQAGKRLPRRRSSRANSGTIGVLASVFDCKALASGLEYHTNFPRNWTQSKTNFKSRDGSSWLLVT